MTARLQCPLCGNTFDPSSRDCRSACPMSAGCAVVCCPRCAYSFPQEDRGLAGLLRKALVRLGRPS